MPISQSKEFFINLKEKDIPKWNKNLSYYDQDPYVLEFFQNEWEKITKGITIDGIFIHPLLYWHVNFFKARITQPDNSEPIINPYLDDHAWYYIENYKQAEQERKGLCMFGTRGFSKTVLEASTASWLATTKYNGIININGGSSKDLKDVCQAIKLSNENIHPAFKLPILTEDWDKDVEFGFRENNSSTFHSRLDIVNHEGGKKSASEKAAGGTPAGFIVDEIGKFDPRDLLDASKPKFFSQYGAKLVHILAGTGGNTELSEGAKIILESPDDYNLIRMNWDRLDSSIPEEAIVWKKTRGTVFCTFVPGAMSYRVDIPKIKKPLSDFLEKPESKLLKKINIFQTDWVRVTEYLKHRRENLSSETARNKEIMYHPFETTDCFLTDSPNPFNVARINAKLQEIKENPKYRLVDLSQNFDGSIETKLSNKKLAEREYKNKDTDAPLMLFEDESKDQLEYMYGAGMDDYKLTEAKESTSLCTFYNLKRRNMDLNVPIETITICYAGRPHSSHNIAYESIRLALKKYRSLCNLEAIDTGFAGYLETLGFNIMEFLTRNLNPSQDLTSNNKSKANSRFGTYPTPGNKKILIDTVVEYTNEELTVGFDENDNPIIKYGVDFIEDPFLLEEMANYKAGGNFDRIVAFGWALIYTRYLDKKNIQPKRTKKYSSNSYYLAENQPIRPKKKSVKFDNFSGKGYVNF